MGKIKLERPMFLGKIKLERLDLSPRVFWGAIAFFVIVRIALVGGMAIISIPHAAYDDSLMVSMASSILKGEWLGNYSQFTLMKGVTFPIFLAVTHVFNIPYLTAMILLYAAGCCALCRSLKSLIKNNLVQLILFVALLFCPISVYFRVYRDGISAALSLFCFATMFGIFLNRESRGWKWWLLSSGVVFFLFVNLREDYIWIIPFFIVALLVVFFKTSGKKKKLMLLIPIIIFLCGNTLISSLNYAYYGVFARSDLTKGAFSEMITAIKSVEPEEDIPFVPVPRSTVEKLYDVSPSFCELKKYIDQNYGAGWDATDGTVDGQIKYGWFFWSLRSCMQQAGYFDSYQEMQEFCTRITDEIQSAIDSGKIEKRKEPIMPSALMSPWRDEYFKELPNAFAETYTTVVGLKNCSVATPESSGSMSRIEEFEFLTHNLAIKSGDMISISGWLAPNDGSTPSAEIRCNGQLLSIVDFYESQDVYTYFANSGVTLEPLKKCRFQINNLTVTDANAVEVWIYNNEGNLMQKVSATPEASGKTYGAFRLHFDYVKTNGTKWKSALQPREKVLSLINVIYSKISSFLHIIALICYLIITGKWVICLIKRKDAKKFTEYWLVLSGLLFSAAINMVGVAYTHISAFSAISPAYLASSYAIVWTFTLLNIIFVVCWLVEYLKNQPRKYKISNK